MASVNSEENEPLFGYTSEAEAIDEMLEDDAVVTDFQHSDESFGVKTIGSVTGAALLMNNMMGVGIPLLPTLLQEAGFVTPIVVLVLVATISGLAATMLTEAMKYIPGNRNFDDRIEYASLCKFYLGNGPYWLIQVILNMSLLSVNILSILETVQVMDWTIVRIFNETCGLVLYPDHHTLNQTLGFECIFPADVCSHSNSPFGNSMVISVGFVVIIVLIIPMGYFNLEDNIFIQFIATAIQTLIIVQWLVTFLLQDLSVKSVSAFGTGVGQGMVLGQVVLNYAFVMTVPSWCNEKRRSSNVNKVVWSSVSISTMFFLLVAILGAFAFPNLDGEDILTRLGKTENGVSPSLLTEISVYLFPIIAVASSIPVFSIIIRYNLMENGICGKFWANVWAVVLPWVLAVPLTAGNTIFNDVITYSSILFQLPINMIIPFWIYILAMRRKAYLKPCYCELGSQCPHDDAPLLAEAPLDGVEQELRSAAGSGVAEVTGSMLVMRHKHVQRSDGQVQKVNVPSVRTMWSDKHPRLARCCGARFSAWMNKPPINPLAKFSVRHPWLAKHVLPARMVAYLDTEEENAVEHFALPDSWKIGLKQAIAVFILALTVIIMLLALGLAIWQTIYVPLLPNDCGSTSGASRIFSRGRRRLNY